jgi:AraC-like DNA-binding protein
MSVVFPEIAESFHIRLLSAGYFRVGPWWSETDRLRSFWRLYVNDENGAALRLPKLVHPMPAQHLVLVPPGVDFEFEFERPVMQLFALFEFIGGPVEAAQQLISAPVTLPRDTFCDRLVDDLREEEAFIDGRVGKLEPILASRLKALIHLSIASVLSDIPNERAGRVLRIAEHQQEILSVLRYIDRNLGKPLTNAKLAEIALTSESRFIRCFRDATGQTPARYVQNRRLRRAAEALVATDHSIDEIAERCGFANRYYFTRVFSQRVGVPPARYRSNWPHYDQGAPPELPSADKDAEPTN